MGAGRAVNFLRQSENMATFHDSEVVTAEALSEAYSSESPPKLRTVPFVTRFERAAALGLRATMLSDGAPSTLPEADLAGKDVHAIALAEYEQKALPFYFKRRLRNGEFEYVRFSDLEQLEHAAAAAP